MITFETARYCELETDYGIMEVTLLDSGKGLRKILIHVGKSGYEVAANAEGIARMVNLALVSGVSIDDLIKQLDGIVTEGKESVASYVVDILKRYKEANLT